MRPLTLVRAAAGFLRAVPVEHRMLVSNSGAIAAGTAVTAAFGFIYWWVAARSFAPEAVGRASALLSLMSLVGVFGESGLGTLLTGEIITRPGRERGLITAAALMAVSLSVAAGVLILLFDLIGPGLALAVDAHPLSGLWLVLGCGVTSLCLILDQAFVGMLQGPIRLLRQFVFSASKLALIGAAALWSGDEAAILLTWVAGQAVSLGVVELLARRKGGRSLIQRPDFRLLARLRSRAVGHYLLDVTIQAPLLALPFVVTVLLSPGFNAAFSGIWMVVSVAFVVPAASATVLLPTGKAEPHRYGDRMLLSLGASLIFALAFGLFIFFYSRQILALFNPAYVEIAGSSLRFLGFGVVGAVVKFHLCASARLSNRMRRASLWFGIGALFELGGAGLGCKIAGLEGVAVAWTGALSIEAIAMWLLLSHCRARSGVWTWDNARSVVEN